MTTDERGVVDRIVNDLAVVLVGDAEDEHHVPVHELPEGAGEGTWLRVRRADGELTVVGIDAEGEQRRVTSSTGGWTESASSAAAAGSGADPGRPGSAWPIPSAGPRPAAPIP